MSNLQQYQYNVKTSLSRSLDFREEGKLKIKYKLKNENVKWLIVNGHISANLHGNYFYFKIIIYTINHFFPCSFTFLFFSDIFSTFPEYCSWWNGWVLSIETQDFPNLLSCDIAWCQAQGLSLACLERPLGHL